MVHKKVEITITNDHIRIPIILNCYIMKQLPILLPAIPADFPTEFQNKIQDLPLADPTFYSGGEIDLLIGGNLFWDLLLPAQIKINSTCPTIQKTKMGWIIVGTQDDRLINCSINCVAFEKLSKIDSTLTKLWDIDSGLPAPSPSIDECEALFIDTTTRANDGKFVVDLPFKEDPLVLGDSYRLALKRFYILERKLKTDPKLKQMYTDFMKDYESKGHMTKLPYSSKYDHPSYYIPLLGVLDESRLTTKLRVVFDASAKTTSSKSLNDILRTGPKTQESLFSILIRFRENPIALAADITQMYRQTWINPVHRKYQRIIWREKDSDPISTYELNTVTYGTAPASFLATRALQEAAHQNSDSFPLGAKAIIEDFYVDDFLSGAMTLHEARNKKYQVERILEPYGLKLRKWNSNKHDTFENEEKTKEPLYFNFNEEWKVLGIHWRPKEDEFFFGISLPLSPNNGKNTKRSILSESSKVFDPLGLISPIIVLAKILLQSLWQKKLNWDEPVSTQVNEQWNSLKQEIKQLKTLKIPRHLKITSSEDIIHIHGFADASKKAYGACVYLVNYSNHPRASTLLCSKSRVTPINPQSQPRLELCAALVLSQLVTTVITSMSHKPTEVHLWSDSCIALCWIQSPAEKWQTFVSARVSAIQANTRNSRGQWHYVPTKDNPSDMISRGTTTKKLTDSTLWWHGPSWLTANSENWPKAPMPIPTSSLPESKPTKILALLSFSSPLSIIHKFSSTTKILRVFAWLKRYLCNLQIKARERKKAPHLSLEQLKPFFVTGNLSSDELNRSMNTCVKSVQNEFFAQEILSLKQNGEVSTTSRLKCLTPFLDQYEVLRVGGRLHNSSLPFQEKHPIILPPRHHWTKTIFLEEHLKNLHVPTNQLLSIVRQKFWPLSGPTVAKRTINRCVPCKRISPHFHTQKMGPLPADRVSLTHPFAISGIDNAGPIYIKSSSRKNAALIKAYICVFVCFATKAIHCELLTSLTAKAFLTAFKRFSSRRGLPGKLYSDNARTFKGANNLISRIFNELMQTPEISSYFANNQIQWKFNAPYSPHLGGLWESSIKCFKRSFGIITKSITFTYEEAETAMIQIEAILNSRPILPLSSDPHDLEALTPAHFLIGRSLLALPSHLPPTSKNSNYLSTWKTFSNIIQTFWSRWQKEYLQQLQTSSKWHRNRPSLKNGSLVILKDKNTPPTCWKLARVVKLHFGIDGNARIAILQTQRGLTSRAVTELCQLPVESSTAWL